MDYLCPLCGRVGVPDPIRTLMDERYAPGRCGTTINDDRHGNRHLTLLRRDIYEASLVSNTGRVRRVRQPTPSQQEGTLLMTAELCVFVHGSRQVCDLPEDHPRHHGGEPQMRGRENHEFVAPAPSQQEAFPDGD
jgi:hypothetical protein